MMGAILWVGGYILVGMVIVGRVAAYEIDVLIEYQSPGERGFAVLVWPVFVVGAVITYIFRGIGWVSDRINRWI